MKKNRMMRLASGLLVLVILTTCIISGTFAKYATGDDAKDSARVAKWGVTTTISGALFGKHYNAFSETEGIENLGSNQIAAAYTGSVDSHAAGEADDGKNIVAPGTKSENMTISIAGKPEVSGKIEFTVNGEESENFSDIWLASGTYGVMADVTDTVKTADDKVGLYVKQGENYVSATADSTEENYYELRDQVTLSSETYDTEEDEPRFTEDNKYYPIIWTFSNAKTVNGETGDSETAGANVHKVSELKAQIDEIIGDNATFNSLTDLGAQVGNTTINWEWPFERWDSEYVAVSPVVDGCDTILGDLIAYKTDGTSNYQVVQIGGTDTAPTYTGVTKTVESGVTYAKAGETQVACLTVGFNLKVVVSQTD